MNLKNNNHNNDIYKLINRRKMCSNTKFNVYFDHLVSIKKFEVKDFLIVKPKIIKDNKIVGICVLPIYNNKFCLMQSWRHQLKEYVYQAPSGFVEENESPDETAIRELREETSLICNPTNLLTLGDFLPDAGLLEGSVTLFLALDCHRSNSKCDEEIGTGKINSYTKEEFKKLINCSRNIGGSTLVASYRALNKIEKLNLF